MIEAPPLRGLGPRAHLLDPGLCCLCAAEAQLSD